MSENIKEIKKENLKFWLSVEKTDPNQTKKVDFGGNKYTAIDPYYQIKTATSMFGSYGEGWGFTDVDIEELKINDDNWIVKFKGVFFYKMDDRNIGSFPILSSFKFAYKTRGANGYLKIDDDYAKKIYTDALTKALSYLGFNSDIYMGKFDDDKYVAYMRELSKLVQPSRLQELEFVVNACETTKEMKLQFDALELNERVDKDVLALFGKKRKELESNEDN